MHRKSATGYIFAIVSAVIYGCMPLMAKFIYAEGVNPMTLVFLRNFLALPSLAILAFPKKARRGFPKKAMPGICLLSFLGCTLTPILLFSSYVYMASGVATVLHFIYPAMVVLGGILFLRKPANAGNLISVTLCVVGVALFYDPAQPLDLTGCILALTSGLAFASYVVLLPGFDRRDLPGLEFSFYIAAASSVMTFLICICTGNLALPATWGGWALCLLFATAVTTGAVVLFQLSTFRIGGEKASILSTLEPITSMIVGFLVFREQIHWQAIAGAVLVVSASVLVAVFPLFQKKRAK